MRWKINTWAPKNPKIGDHKFKVKFALIPCRLPNGYWVWLEKVVVRYTLIREYDSYFDSYENVWGRKQYFDYKEFPTIIDYLNEVENDTKTKAVD